MSKPANEPRRPRWIGLGLLLLAFQLVVSLGCPGETPPTTTAVPDENPRGSATDDVDANDAGTDKPVAGEPESPTAPSATDESDVPQTALPDRESTENGTDHESTDPAETNAPDDLGLPGETQFNAPRTVPAAANSQDGNKLPQLSEAPLYEGWEQPELVFLLSGRQHGYIEPCGCTGLANQKGGLLRRHSCLQELQAKGWNVVPLDLGNQVRRFGAQASIKFARTAETLSQVLGYRAIGLGPDDLKLPSTDLIQAIENSRPEGHVFTSANVALFGDYLPTHRVVEAAGHRVGVTSVLGDRWAAEVRNDDAEVKVAAASLKTAAAAMDAEGCELKVLLAFASIDETKELVRAVPAFDLVVTAGGDGEPTLAPEMIDAGERQIPMIQAGVKGMYVGVVGWFPDETESLKYQRVPLDDRFEDSPQVAEIFKAYQEQLKTLGLTGLELSPVPHPSGHTFVGSETCGECHSTAYDIWKNGVDGQGGPHFHATKSLVEPGERTWVQRHYDPECLSCHVTGWHPQRYFPYEGGYLELEASAHLHGNGCENCHGPGSQHVAAENGDIDADETQLAQFRDEMRVALEATMCMECHDLDNSPDFHVDGAFEEYWAKIIHEGVD